MINGSCIIVAVSMAFTLLLILGGFIATVVGVIATLAFGGLALMPIALVGLICMVSGIMFAIKVVGPAWSAMEEEYK